MMQEFKKKRNNSYKKTHGFLLLAICVSLSSCLNSAVNTENGVSADSRGNGGVAALSPWAVQIQWKSSPGAESYEIYSGADTTIAPTNTKFLKATVVVEPGVLYDYKVYPKLTSGREDLRPYNFAFQSWNDFSGAVLGSKPTERSGIIVTYRYKPWDNLAGSAIAVSSMTTECAFISNAQAGDDPFTKAGAIKISAPTQSQEVADAGCSLQPGTLYLASCRVTYVDGTSSLATEKLSFTTPNTCVASNVVLPEVIMDKIQYSAFPAYLFDNLSSGLINHRMVSLNKDANGLTEDKVVLPNESLDNASNTQTSVLVERLTELLHQGLVRLMATFKSSEIGSKEFNISPADFYIKSVNGANEIVYPPIINVESAQQMGRAMASGDFDCDGNEDIAIGLPYATWVDSSDIMSPPKKNKTGVVVVLYGKPTFSLFYNITPARNPLQPTSGSDPKKPTILVPFTKDSSEKYGVDEGRGYGAGFGFALASGNFNRDANPTSGHGCKDLAIGAPWEDFASTPTSNIESAGGSVYIAYGGKEGLSDTWTAHRMESSDSGTCSPPPLGSNSSLPVANVDHTPPYPMSASAQSCEGYHLFAPAVSSLYEDAANYNNPTSSYYKSHYNNIAIPRGRPNNFSAFESSEFGFSLATGDLDMDGYDDLLIGAPSAVSATPNQPVNDTPDIKRTGAAFLYFGGLNGIRTNYNLGSMGSGQAELELSASPVKIMLPMEYVKSTGFSLTGTQLGYSVGLGHLRYDDNSNTSLARGNASLFVGIPGFNYNQGAVIAAHWKFHFNNGPAETDLGFENGYPVLQVGNTLDYTFNPPGAAPTLLYPGAYVLPMSGATRFGSSIVVGSFRDPNRGNRTSNMDSNSNRIIGGYDHHALKPVNEVLAVGAPAYNSNEGAVFLFTDQALAYDPTEAAQGGDGVNPPSGWKKSSYVDSRYPTSHYFSVVNLASAGSIPSNTPLCETVASNDPALEKNRCRPGIRILNPSGLKNSFGTTLAAARVPPDIKLCKDSGEDEFCQSGAYTYLNLSDKSDVLMIGAPGTSSTSAADQRAYLVSNSPFDYGVNPVLSQLRGASISAGSGYGLAMAAAYLEGRNYGFYAFVGAPSINTPVRESGNVFWFRRDSSGVLNMTAPSNLGLLIPREDGLARPYNISRLTTLGFHKSKPVGDLNCDGFTDVMFPVEYEYDARGSKAARLLIMYGSPSGLVTTNVPATPASPRKAGDPRAPQWVDLSLFPNFIDEQAATNFAGVGNVNGDKYAGKNCDDVVLMNKASIIFYGSSAGLITDPPQETGVSIGNSPQLVKMYLPTVQKSSYLTGLFNLGVNESNGFYTYTNGGASLEVGPDDNNLALNPLFDMGTPPRAHYADYDGRGTGAVIPDTQAPLPEPSLQGVDANRDVGSDYLCNDGGCAVRDPALDFGRYPRSPPICHGDFNNDGYNDVVVGGGQYLSVNGRYSSSDVNGVTRYYLGTQTVGRANAYLSVFYGSGSGLQSGSGKKANDTFSANCDENGCIPHRLYHPGQFWDVSNHSSGTADAFYPYRTPWREHYVRTSVNNNSSQKSHGGVMRDLFGETCTSVGDINGDRYDDLVVTYPFGRSKFENSKFTIFFGSGDGLRQKHVNDDPLGPYMVRLVTADGSASAFKPRSLFGLSATGLGDVNGDGYNDFAISARANRSPGGDADKDKGSFVIVYGRDGFPSKLRNDPDMAGNSYMGGNVEYEKWGQIKVRKQGPTSTEPACSTASGSSICALQVVAPNDASARFASEIVPGGDLNADGFADVVASDPDYNSIYGFSGVGRALVYFGNQMSAGDLNSGLHTSQAPFTKAHCVLKADKRLCQPLSLLPKYAEEYSAAVPHNQVSSAQFWRPRNSIIFRSYSSAGFDDPLWHYTNLGSSAGTNAIDQSSSDLLMCVNQNFSHKDQPTSRDLGACTRYW